MTSDNPRYTSDEVSAIIRHGLQASRTETIDHQDLVEIGREFGLDRDAIEAAVQKQQQEQRLERRARRKKAGFTSHLYAFIGVNALLLLIDIMTPGPWWFQLSVLGWGIGLFFHYRAVQSSLRRLGIVSPK